MTIEANKKIVNFLDVTLDLTTGRFKPFSKPATTPLYMHSKSNHPPSIIRNIPEAINLIKDFLKFPVTKMGSIKRHHITKKHCVKVVTCTL